MDEHVPGVILFNLQHLSWALTRRRGLKKLIPFAQGKSPLKDAGLQPEKRDERALLTRFVYVPTTCPSLSWLRMGSAVGQQGRRRREGAPPSGKRVVSWLSVAAEPKEQC